MKDRWLSVDEIAEYIGVKRYTIYKWIAEREMPSHRVGRFWKFKREPVDIWVEAGAAGSTEDNQDIAKTYHTWQQMIAEREYKNIPEYCYSAKIEEESKKALVEVFKELGYEL